MVTREMLDKLDHKMQVMFAVFCIKQILHLIDNRYKKACLRSIEIAEDFIEGKVTGDEIYTDVGIEYTIIGYLFSVVTKHSFSSYFAASVAEVASITPNVKKKAIQLEQIRYYEELLNFDNIVEQMMGLQ